MPENTPNLRKTFAIISHPDAGKTTLTEKLLLFGGAITQAGAVKARGENRRAHSDWMKVEQERGISVASSVMTFEYNDITFNLSKKKNKWVIDEMDKDTLEKIHGIYNYENDVE